MDDQRTAAGRFARQMRAEVRARKIGEATAEGVTRALRAAAEKHVRGDCTCSACR